jgi:hypothetical protein
MTLEVRTVIIFNQVEELFRNYFILNINKTRFFIHVLTCHSCISTPYTRESTFCNATNPQHGGGGGGGGGGGDGSGTTQNYVFKHIGQLISYKI